MRKYRGGQKVGKGIYWNLSTWEFVPVAKEGGMLPGGSEVSYLKPPLSAMLVMGPAFGLGYIIFLPLLGFLGVGAYLVYRVGRALRTAGDLAFREVLQVTAPNWRPGVSYLARRGYPPAAKPKAEKKREELLEKLEKEIIQKRQKPEDPTDKLFPGP